ncbi:amino acid ABC transporter substrate-binding protein [Amycolatopsis acidicola]|uniref:Amino acid ABC transporter substrate-binding protein n=1 Tax=Amycolatopsis acidicola TaxID=2596893 RepID=A0A5N0VLJ8_9PSEU|nr:ABC transporter substrate-binding protein [Amycolatopsis acidicola]KAA9165612.1 amino acid ABC transporter substrate-binding protein [Amycolatopsis acidicola]
MKTLPGLTALCAATLLLASCSSGGSNGSGTPDQALKIGSLLAQTGSQASAVEPLVAATQLAINDINAAGGVFGKNVEYKQQDSTSDNDTALSAAQSLISWGADEVIGTYGSGMAGAVVEPVTQAGALMVSGSNTSSNLTGISPLYFRTAPTDALEAASIADLLVKDGRTSVGIVWQNDSWGEAFEKSLVDNLNTAGIKIAANQPFNTDATDFTSQVNAVVAAKPDAVVFLSYATYTGAMLEQLVGTNHFPSKNVYFSSSTLGSYEGKLSNQAYLQGVQAFQPGAAQDTETQFEAKLKQLNPKLSAFAYAASTYDATIIAALGAIAANSTDGATIAKKMREISGGTGGGEKCTTFADCRKLLADGKTIDYDGLTGGIAFDEKNDETETNYIAYVYGADGKYTVKQ